MFDLISFFSLSLFQDWYSKTSQIDRQAGTTRFIAKDLNQRNCINFSRFDCIVLKNFSFFLRFLILLHCALLPLLLKLLLLLLLWSFFDRAKKQRNACIERQRSSKVNCKWCWWLLAIALFSILHTHNFLSLSHTLSESVGCYCCFGWWFGFYFLLLDKLIINAVAVCVCVRVSVCLKICLFISIFIFILLYFDCFVEEPQPRPQHTKYKCCVNECDLIWQHVYMSYGDMSCVCFCVCVSVCLLYYYLSI